MDKIYHFEELAIKGWYYVEQLEAYNSYYNSVWTKKGEKKIFKVFHKKDPYGDKYFKEYELTRGNRYLRNVAGGLDKVKGRMVQWQCNIYRNEESGMQFMASHLLED